MKVRTATPCRAMRDPRTCTHRRDARGSRTKGKVTRGGKVLPCLASIGTCWKRKKAHKDSGEAGHSTAKAGGARSGWRRKGTEARRYAADNNGRESKREPLLLGEGSETDTADTHAAKRWRDEEVAVPEGAAQGGTATDDPEAKAQRTEAGG
ncbi:hypothetical protein ERJ75_001144500 [Trypanosoma vivax]|nr:hypothetical protein ERJ75_001144500 [Trypanosoma vivax]